MATPKSGKTAPITIDESQLEKLASIGCTVSEMAAFFDCSIDTINRNYAAALSRGRDSGKASVRRMMWKHGESGNSTALKYLVHNILKEKFEDKDLKPDASTDAGISEQLKDVTNSILIKILKTANKSESNDE